MKIGLFFGSFNPVHVGHMIIANYMITHTDLDKVWMVVSPHNPLKEKKNLAKDYDRLHLVRLAIATNLKIKASDVEFGLPKPSYTIDTLAHLKDIEPDKTFTLIMGGDNLASLHKWKNYQSIIDQYRIFVYNRSASEDKNLAENTRIQYFDAPMLNISASYIRKEIKNGHSVQYLVPQGVFEYIDGSNMYKSITRKDH